MNKKNNNSRLTISTEEFAHQKETIAHAYAESWLHWTDEKKNLFGMVLAKISLLFPGEKVIRFSKEELLSVLHFTAGEEDANEFLGRVLKQFRKDTAIKWTNPSDSEKWIDGPLILLIASNRTQVFLELDEFFLPHIKELVKENAFPDCFHCCGKGVDKK